MPPPPDTSLRRAWAGEGMVLGTSAILIGLTKAGFGGGTGALIAPLLSLRMSSRRAIGLMLPMLLATDAFNCLVFFGHWNFHHWLWLTPTSTCGILVGAKILKRLDDRGLRRSIGCIAVAFSLLQLARDPGASPPAWVQAYWFGAIMGFTAGVFSTIAHVGGILTTMYLIAQQLPPEQFVATAAAVYLFQNIIKLQPYLSQKLISNDALALTARYSPLVILGVIMGCYFSQTVDPHIFTRTVLILTLITGMYLLIQTRSEISRISDRMELAAEVALVEVNPA